MKLLFVDDEPRVLAGLEQSLFFAPDDWSADFAGSVDEALGMLDTGAYDLVVTDMKMPELNGADLLEHLRQHHPSVLRIILSGEMERELADRAIPLCHEFLPKPCDSTTLIDTIERLTASAQALRNTSVEGLLDALHLPHTQPAMLARVQDAVMSGAEPSQIAREIEADLALSTVIIRTANTAFYGFRNPASTLDEAVNRLGSYTVGGIVLLGEFTKNADGTLTGQVEKLNAHAVKVGHDVRKLIGSEAPQAGLAGLLHDVGLIMLLTQFPTQYGRLLDSGSNLCPDEIAAEEIEQFGASHAEIGARLLEMWNMHPLVVEVTRHHHSRNGASPEATRILHALAAVEWTDHPDRDIPAGVPDELVEQARRLAELASAG